MARAVLPQRGAWQRWLVQRSEERPGCAERQPCLEEEEVLVDVVASPEDGPGEEQQHGTSMIGVMSMVE